MEKCSVKFVATEFPAPLVFGVLGDLGEHDGRKQEYCCS